MGLKFVEIIMAAEKEFGIEIPDASVATLQRVGDLHAEIVAALAKRSSDVSSDAVWIRLRRLVAGYVAVPPASITPEDDFFVDLRTG